MDAKKPSGEPSLTPAISAQAADAHGGFTEFQSATARYITALQNPQMSVPMQAHEVQRLAHEWQAHFARFAMDGLSAYLQAIAKRTENENKLEEKRAANLTKENRRMFLLTVVMVIAAGLQAYAAIRPLFH